MARFELTLEVDVEVFQRAIDRRLIADLQTAMVEGLNAAGDAVVKTVQKWMATAFYRLNFSYPATVRSAWRV